MWCECGECQCEAAGCWSSNFCHQSVAVDEDLFTVDQQLVATSIQDGGTRLQDRL